MAEWYDDWRSQQRKEQLRRQYFPDQKVLTPEQVLQLEAMTRSAGVGYEPAYASAAQQPTQPEEPSIVDAGKEVIADAVKEEAKDQIKDEIKGAIKGGLMGKGVSDLFGGGSAGDATTQILDPRDAAGFYGAGGGAPSGWSVANVGSAGNYYLPIAGALGTADLFMNQRTGRRGYLQGAASGAALGSYFGPPGAAIGAVIGTAGAGLNELFDTNKYKTEGNRRAKLREQGILTGDLTDRELQNRGISKQELVAAEQAKIDKGEYGNVKFAESRNEADLNPRDIVDYATFGEKYGADWYTKYNQAQREEIAKRALAAGAVREHHGTVDVDFSKFDSTVPNIGGPKTAAPAKVKEPVKDKKKKPTPTLDEIIPDFKKATPYADPEATRAEERPGEKVSAFEEAMRRRRYGSL